MSGRVAEGPGTLVVVAGLSGSGKSFFLSSLPDSPSRRDRLNLTPNFFETAKNEVEMLGAARFMGKEETCLIHVQIPRNEGGWARVEWKKLVLSARSVTLVLIVPKRVTLLRQIFLRARNEKDPRYFRQHFIKYLSHWVNDRHREFILDFFGFVIPARCFLYRSGRLVSAPNDQSALVSEVERLYL